MKSEEDIRRLKKVLETMMEGQMMGDIDPQILGKWKAVKYILDEEY